jgi:hypothetical protein
MFQVQTGFAIDGFTVEDWLAGNPFTVEDEDAIHYRFYIMNLEDLVQVTSMNLMELIPYALVGTAVAGIAVLVIIRYKRSR